MGPNAASKAELRRAMRLGLASKDPASARSAAVETAARAQALPLLADASVVLCCLSFGRELDTRHLIDRLLATERQVWIPRCVESTRELTVHAYPCALERLSFGLEQPTAQVPALDPARLDVALLVGLAFDNRGYRLGYGGGYFDRFLAAHAMPAIGLAYESQLIERLPVAEHDVPMAAVVTERRIVEPVVLGPGTAKPGPGPGSGQG